MDRARYLQLVGPAIELVAKKSEDYNNGGQDDVHAYFPFGIKSYAQMVHVKSMRFVSLAKQDVTPNFESQKDTLWDLINYCVFALDALDKGEQPKKAHPAINLQAAAGDLTFNPGARGGR